MEALRPRETLTLLPRARKGKDPVIDCSSCDKICRVESLLYSRCVNDTYRVLGHLFSLRFVYD
ncbi:hypothetical protein E2C01_012354 [Portunus trituberculatus]|uniref:Uncharacterized protein n=1 Tax=Portunus trituberculatus TaxID=210409 RepID=A0A5B7DDM4_PORTR|nr:hypothetical protein [Portunus trituberculatus]